MELVIQGRPIIAGEADALVLASREPLSFWGGYDQNTGEIIDRRHPLSGEIAAARVLALPAARGSSTTTAVLLESVRTGHAPAALVTDGPDRFFALASIVAEEMYGRPIPLVALTPEDFALLHSGQRVRVQPDGTIVVTDCA